MRVVVTGATGQVGAALVERLHTPDATIGIDRSILDLSRPETVANVLDELAPDVLINAAAYTAVDKAEDEPELAHLVNAETPGVMACWAAKRGVPFVHFSTDYVFDGSGERPWTEDDEPRPLSVYGASKLAGEAHIRAAQGCFLIIRTSWVYGSRGTNFLRAIAALAGANTELRVVSDQIGAPTPAALIADTVHSMVEGGTSGLRNAAEQAGGIVHLASSGETSWHGFAIEIVGGLRARGVSLAVERIIPILSEERATRARRPANSRLSLERLHANFGIMPPHWRTTLAPEIEGLAAELIHA